MADQKASQQPVTIKTGDDLCVVDNQLQKIPLAGDFYYLSGSTDAVLQAFQKSLDGLMPEEVLNTRYPIPGTYKNIIVPELVAVFIEQAKKIMPNTGDSRLVRP